MDFPNLIAATAISTENNTGSELSCALAGPHPIEKMVW